MNNIYLSQLAMDLDTILLNFSENKSKTNDFWTLRDAVRGTQILGGIGSGKSSGSGKMLATVFLKKGFGGLVLCAKPEERKSWENLAEATGRSNDLIIMNESNEHYFNALKYEDTRKGGGEVFNLVNLFMQIYQMGKLISGEGLSSNTERFWDNALKRCLSRTIDFLKLANEEVTIKNMHKLISHTLTSKEFEKLRELQTNGNEDASFKEIIEWSKQNYYLKCFVKSSEVFSNSIGLNDEMSQIIPKRYYSAKDYFEREFANLAEKTKTIIVESFLGLVEPFQSGILEKYFSRDTNISPEDTFQKGKIIILDFPVKDYLDSGLYAQGIFKLLWQQAIERRSYNERIDTPAFLWVDESQLFLSSYDQIFQTTARSAGACTVFLTQNISNYYTAIGGKNPKPTADSLLGNLCTKIFHTNNDSVTNEWSANTIGKNYYPVRGWSINSQETTANSNDQFNYQVPPIEFTTLKSGKSENGKSLEFDTRIVVAGRTWSNDRNYIKYTFKQPI